jgi:hypothetical protein
MPNNYVLLDRIELNATAASVTFDNIPQSGYTDLKLVYSARTNVSSTSDHILMQFNNSTTSLTGKRLVGNGAAAASYSVTSGPAGQSSGNTSTANTFGSGEIYIPNYRGSTNKSWSADGVSENNATSAAAEINAGLWSNTAAITSIKLIQEVGTAFLANSTFSLYGLAQVGTTPAIAPKADGGNVIGTDGTYWYHAFLSNGTFTPQVGLSCQYLVIAGGASGGQANGGGGGGGAGGYRSSVTGESSGGGASAESPLSLIANTSYTVTVGAGGAKVGSGSTLVGNDGNDSTFATITSTKGGGGAADATPVGRSGGSGGGGAGSAGTNAGGAGTANQGRAGGSGSSDEATYRSYGGGGGASVAGANGSTSASTGANGGNGIASSITGSSVTRAGGGGGGQVTGGTGGTGGGGAGGNRVTDGGDGTINTGSGGGGNGKVSPNANNGAGGSGIVIIRYLVA